MAEIALQAGFEHGMRWVEAAEQEDILTVLHDFNFDRPAVRDLFPESVLNHDTSPQFVSGALRAVMIGQLRNEWHEHETSGNRRSEFERKLDALASDAIDAAYDSPENGDALKLALFLVDFARADANKRSELMAQFSPQQEIEVMKINTKVTPERETATQTHDND